MGRMKQKMTGLTSLTTGILIIFALYCITGSESKRKGIEQTLNGSNETGRSLQPEGTPRICPSSTTTTAGGTDFGITSIFTSLFGGDLSAVGFALGIPVAIGSAIFWGIVFLIIYYVVFYKKSEEGGYGGGGGYGQTPYGSQYGRSLMNSNLNKLSDFAWKAIDKFAEYNESPK